MSYSQVHELHPSHAFLAVPDRPTRSNSEPDYISPVPPDSNEEQCKPFVCRRYPLSAYKPFQPSGIQVSSALSKEEFTVWCICVSNNVSCSCLLDIVGARFHCAICDSVDICANCESAGLPGNLDSADGGHNSSHILIKVKTFSL